MKEKIRNKQKPFKSYFKFSIQKIFHWATYKSHLNTRIVIDKKKIFLFHIKCTKQNFIKLRNKKKIFHKINANKTNRFCEIIWTNKNKIFPLENTLQTNIKIIEKNSHKRNFVFSNEFSFRETALINNFIIDLNLFYINNK